MQSARFSPLLSICFVNLTVKLYQDTVRCHDLVLSSLSCDWGCSAKRCGSLQAKVAIRELLPNGLRESISKVRSSVAYAVSAVAHWDWPEAWPELFNLLMEMLVSGDVNAVHGAMRVLTGTCTQQGTLRRCCRLFLTTAFCPFVLQMELELAAAAPQGSVPAGCCWELRKRSVRLCAAGCSPTGAL